MRYTHPFFWTQFALCLLVSIFIVAAAQAGKAEKAANRIVSVGGAITEIVYALGEEDRLVARDTTSNYPSEVRALPDVAISGGCRPRVFFRSILTCSLPKRAPARWRQWSFFARRPFRWSKFRKVSQLTP